MEKGTKENLILAGLGALALAAMAAGKCIFNLNRKIKKQEEIQKRHEILIEYNKLSDISLCIETHGNTVELPYIEITRRMTNVHKNNLRKFEVIEDRLVIKFYFSNDHHESIMHELETYFNVARSELLYECYKGRNKRD